MTCIDDIKENKTLISYKNLEKRLGYTFKNIALLEEAMVHPSFLHESKKRGLKSNQRMEFLGDSILNAIISQYLFNNIEENEGKLTNLRSLVVCEGALVKIAGELKLNLCLKLGKGEIANGGLLRPSINADTLEALIAAIFLDSDFDTVRNVILPFFVKMIKNIENLKDDGNYKSKLQEYLQKTSKEVVCYEIYKEEGEAHNKTYYSKIVYSGKTIGKGAGKTKKQADQNAAKDAITKLGI